MSRSVTTPRIEDVPFSPTDPDPSIQTSLAKINSLLEEVLSNKRDPVYQNDVVIATFLATLSAALFSYAYQASTQSLDGENPVTQVTQLCWLLAIWLNLTSVLVCVIRDEFDKRRNTKKGATYTASDILRDIAHFVMAVGLVLLLAGLASYVWKKQNRGLGIAMTVMGSLVLPIALLVEL
ncbi:hypothetical protein BDV93DRAFT_564889 [Ceratobasidium sp. AG-I]|nr:hypothetical protein BDV93DRAFT_564889 [Ceratobasidium sp. AG-I]